MSIGTFLQIQSDVYSSLLLQCVFAGNKDKYVNTLWPGFEKGK